MKKLLPVLLCAGLCAAPAASAKTVTTLGTGVAIALPLIAGGITVSKRDWTGTAQLTVDTLATVGTSLALKQVIRERRPDGSDFESMPSDTSALAFAPAQFLWDRYGWQYGVPAYMAASFVGFTRVDAKKHHWYDVAASAGLAFGFSKLITTEYRGRWDYSASLTDGGVYAGVQYRF